LQKTELRIYSEETPVMIHLKSVELTFDDNTEQIYEDITAQYVESSIPEEGVPVTSQKRCRYITLTIPLSSTP
jgi:hypothetical protein